MPPVTGKFFILRWPQKTKTTEKCWNLMKFPKHSVMLYDVLIQTNRCCNVWPPHGILQRWANESNGAFGDVKLCFIQIYQRCGSLLNLSLGAGHLGSNSGELVGMGWWQQVHPSSTRVSATTNTQKAATSSCHSLSPITHAGVTSKLNSHTDSG